MLDSLENSIGIIKLHDTAHTPMVDKGLKFAWFDGWYEKDPFIHFFHLMSLTLLSTEMLSSRKTKKIGQRPLSDFI